MKKLVLTGLVLASSSLYAIDFNGIEETYKNQIQHCWRWCKRNHDKVATNFINNNDVCFNASDIVDNNGYTEDNSTITTKIAGEKFYLKITKKPECDVDEVKYQLIDNTTGDVLSEANITNPTVVQYVDFNIPNSYKDVAIKFIYNKMIEEEACPTETSEFTFTGNNACDVSAEATNNQFHFRVRFGGNKEKCYDFTRFQHHLVHFRIDLAKVSCGNDPFQFQFKPNINDIAATDEETFRVPVVGSFKCYKVTVNNSISTITALKNDLGTSVYDSSLIDLINNKYTKEEINCTDIPANKLKYQCEIIDSSVTCNLENTNDTLFVKDKEFYIVLPDYDCYENTLTANSDVTDSDTSDEFAIRPDKFNIALEKTNVKVNELIPFSISAIMADGNIATNYSASSTDLLVTFSNPDTYPKYSFDITNGIDPKGSLYLTKAGTTDMNVTDKNFANVDEDDTADDQRFIKGSTSTSTTSSSSNTATANGSGSKYWAGVGTNEEQNDPTKNTINSEIRQNIKKDLHFNRVNW